MSRRPDRLTRPAWRGNAAGVAILALLLQLLLGPAAMLRMAAGHAMAGGMMPGAVHAAATSAVGLLPHGPVPAQRAHHHEECPVCAGAGPLAGAGEPLHFFLALNGRVFLPRPTSSALSAPELARSYNPRAPPLA